MAAAARVFEKLAVQTWEWLELSRALQLSIGETTITDINLLELKREGPPDVHVYKAIGRDEPEKGFDWEWYVGNPRGGWWRYAVQAKKLSLSTNRYRSFRHRIRGRQQLSVLEDFARSNRAIALYCFYNSRPEAVERAYWSCGRAFGAKQLGCSVLPLNGVRSLHRTAGAPSFEDVHQHRAALPWRCIVDCPLLSPSASCRHPLHEGDWEVAPLAELPAFLADSDSHGTIELPQQGYSSELGGYPKRIAVLHSPEDVGSTDTCEPTECG